MNKFGWVIIACAALVLGVVKVRADRKTAAMQERYAIAGERLATAIEHLLR